MPWFGASRSEAVIHAETLVADLEASLARAGDSFVKARTIFLACAPSVPTLQRQTVKAAIRPDGLSLWGLQSE